MSNDNLLKMARLARTEIEIGGERLLVKEPSALELIEYREGLRDKEKGRAFALTILIHACVINDDGSQRLSVQDAKDLVEGSNRVVIPLINVLTNFTNADDATKKEEAPSEDSSSSSPSP